MAKPKKSAKKKAAAKKAGKSSGSAKSVKSAKASATDLSVDEIVEREMPGWRVVNVRQTARIPIADSGTMKSQKGPSIAQLKRKFLGDGARDAAGDQDAGFAPVNDKVKTVRIEPKAGGPSKTADIRKGKINIVQG
jgi:hypothetical protein